MNENNQNKFLNEINQNKFLPNLKSKYFTISQYKLYLNNLNYNKQKTFSQDLHFNNFRNFINYYKEFQIYKFKYLNENYIQNLNNKILYNEYDGKISLNNYNSTDNEINIKLNLINNSNKQTDGNLNLNLSAGNLVSKNKNHSLIENSERNNIKVMKLKSVKFWWI